MTCWSKCWWCGVRCESKATHYRKHWARKGTEYNGRVHGTHPYDHPAGWIDEPDKSLSKGKEAQ